jgi:hypothetical protein
MHTQLTLFDHYEPRPVAPRGLAPTRQPSPEWEQLSLFSTGELDEPGLTDSSPAGAH